jgi:hypothetical protein
MKKKKCFTLVRRLIVFSMAISVFCSSGFGNVKAATMNDVVTCSAKQAERQIYTGTILTKISSAIGSDLIQGDINGDGCVNSIDFAHMRLYLLGDKKSLITPDKVLIADLNMDHLFNSVDLGIMRGYLLGIYNKYLNDNNVKPSSPAVPSAPVVILPSPTTIPTAPKPQPTSGSASDDDFTNTISKASYVVEVGKEVKGKLDFEGDKDYMIFIPPVNGKYRVEIFTNIDNTIGYLYSEKIEGLDYYYSSFKTYCSDDRYYIEQDLVGGTKYYLGIKNINGKKTLDSYTIIIKKVG